MTLYERLVQDLKHGKYPVVVDKDGYYRIFYHLREDGELRSFGCSQIIEEAWCEEDSLLWSQQEIEDRVDKHGFKFHSYFYPPIKPYKVGQKVRVSKEILKIKDKNSNIKKWAENETIVEIIKQEESTFGLYVYNCKDNDGHEWYVSNAYLEPVYDDEPTMTKEEFLALGMRQGWVREGKIIN